jgi:PAS domain S-box-containing protein
MGTPPATAAEALLDDVSEGAYMVDATDRIVAANMRLGELLELPPGLLRPGDPLDKLNEYLFERGEYPTEEAYRRIRSTLRAAHQRSFVTVHERANGRLLEIRGRPQQSGGFIVTLADVTERKRATEALRISEERVRNTFSLAPVGITICDLSARFLEANEAFCHMTGYAAEELRRTNVHAITHPDDVGANVGLLSRLLRGEIPSFRLEKRYLRKDGNVVWARISVSLVRDGEGLPMHMFAFSEDVTWRRQAEQALHESEERYRSTFALAPAGITICDLSSRFLAVNEAFCHMTGYSEQELLRTDVYSITHPDDVAVNAALVERLISGERPAFLIEKRYIRKDGGVVWVKISVSLVRDAEGRPLHMFAFTEDVTRRHLAEQALRETEARYKEVFDNTSDCLFLIDVTPERRFKLVSFNPAEERATGLTTAQVAGKYVEEIMPLPIAAAVTARYRECIEKGEPISYEQELDLPAGRGTFHTKLIPVRNAAGKIHRLVGIASNITAQQRTTLALSESEARFRALTSNLPGVIYSTIVEPDGAISEGYVSPGVHRMLGVQPEELMSGWTHLIDFAHPEDRQAQLQALRESARTLDPLAIEARMIARSGETRWWQITMTPKRRANGSVQFDGIALDITDRKLAEEQLHQALKMESVGQLTGGVAHDFNNLLTVMLGSAELLDERVPPEDAKASRLLRNIMDAGRQGAELTQRLLAFARRQPLDPRLIEIDQLVEDLTPLLRRSLGEAIEILPAFRAEHRTANIDANQLENAILNLAVNARDAMPDGGRLVIETATVTIDRPWADRYGDMAPGPHILISVSDEGTGMPAEVVARAVEPFFTTKPPGRGTGLGLSMVYGFVKQSGGHMTIYSELGHGTAINIYLPEARREGAPETEPEVSLVIPHGSESILYVEDDDVVRDIVLKMLTLLGYQVTTASNGPQAVEILHGSQPIDLLFTDVVLPGGIGGRQVAEAARRHRPALKVLYTSGYTEGAILHHGRLEPGIRLLKKPFQIKSLADSVRQALDDEA